MYMSSDLNKEEIPVFNSRKRPLNLRIVCGRLYMGVDCKVIRTVKGWENTYPCQTPTAKLLPQSPDLSSVNNKKDN